MPQYYPQQLTPPPPPPKNRRKVAMWVGFGVLMSMVLGAAIWGAVAESRSAGSAVAAPVAGSQQSAVTAGQTTVVTATDKKSQLTVPVSWKDVPKSFRSEQAVIQLGDLRREQYIIVITLDKNDFEDFSAFSGAMVDGAKSALDSAQVSEQRNLTIGGLPAVQYQITGKAGGINIVFWYTMVEGKNGFYQLVSWTLPSKRAEAEPAIVEVTNSFKELDAA